ncbi:head decoration protein [Vibrio vulnificus]|uniref:head decoration protein n=1 Tax=Vibrio vulnificus TaxID=672 RepID=UPI00063DCC5D|nr:head decoration protein [Vibrio vulnificus]EJN6716955.1 head decoration protein [Vibrio vulnificus]EJO9866807.1 head decoration protein [Vibrio vulnificus]KLI66018.1 head-DNA stabilization protein [Vibrio vulnificus CladeA-yb158]MBN8108648.1 head decoration protein [Vibrio vulnificus]MBN8146096.1 head decoration protein [Vibrio vulnificus]
MDVTEYNPDEYLLSAPVTIRGTIKAGAVFPKLTPLMVDTTDAATLVKWDGTPGKAVAMAAREVTASGADQTAVIYVQGGFRTSFVNWPEAVNTDKAKRAAFIGSAIYVDDEA